MHHIIRRNGNKHAEEINQLDDFFACCLKEPNEYKATREDLERHRELVNKASIEELGNYEVILTTCAMGGNKKLVKGAKEQIFQVSRLCFVKRQQFLDIQVVWLALDVSVERRSLSPKNCFQAIFVTKSVKKIKLPVD